MSDGWPWEDTRDPPKFCPVCGRTLVRSSWTTVDGMRDYHLLRCDGPDNWLTELRLKLDLTSFSHGRHYTYALGPTRAARVERFDSMTGREARR